MDLPFISCPPSFDVMCFEHQLIIKLKDQFVDEELIFLSHISFDDDTYDLINKSSSIIGIPPVDQDEPLDEHEPDDFLLAELYGDDYLTNMDEYFFLHEDLDLQKFQMESEAVIDKFLLGISPFYQANDIFIVKYF